MMTINWHAVTPREIESGRHRYDGPVGLPPEGHRVDVLLEDGRTESIGWVRRCSNEYVFTVPGHGEQGVIGWR